MVRNYFVHTDVERQLKMISFIRDKEALLKQLSLTQKLDIFSF